MRDAPHVPLPGTDVAVRMHVRSPSDLPAVLFASTAARERLRHLRHDRLSLPRARDTGGAALGELLVTRRTEHGVGSVWRIGSVIALVDERRGSASVEVAGADATEVNRAAARIAERLGAIAASGDELPVTFWARGEHGPRAVSRRIETPAWSELRPGYGPATSAAIDSLVGSGPPQAGRLVLWQGEPGTGKTTALRALARAWHAWCSTHFVTDPDAFLGSGTSYLMDVLTSEGSALDWGAPVWKLVVLEDAGELLTADAHARAGQALSRLLNVTDGLLGHGMNAILLVTTNDPLTRLHPAVQRAGRCWARTEFAALDVGRANAWLERCGSAVRVARPTPLADLYAALRGEQPADRVTFGFGGAR